jgi:hypothetical protein
MSDTDDERELRDRATVERVMGRHLSIVKRGEDSIGDDHDEDSLVEHPLNVEIEKSDESLTTPKHGLFSDRTKSGDLGDTISFFNNPPRRASGRFLWQLCVCFKIKLSSHIYNDLIMMTLLQEGWGDSPLRCVTTQARCVATQLGIRSQNPHESPLF